MTCQRSCTVPSGSLTSRTLTCARHRPSLPSTVSAVTGHASRSRTRPDTRQPLRLRRVTVRCGGGGGSGSRWYASRGLLIHDRLHLLDALAAIPLARLVRFHHRLRGAKVARLAWQHRVVLATEARAILR